MSSVSFSGGNTSAKWSAMQPSRTGEASRSAQLFSKLDVNGDSGIDASELGAFADTIAQKPGTTAMDADALMTSLDTDGDGSVSSTELAENMHSLFDQLQEQLMGEAAGGAAPPGDAMGFVLEALLKEYGAAGSSETLASKMQFAA